jgi:hypothetical protein
VSTNVCKFGPRGLPIVINSGDVVFDHDKLIPLHPVDFRFSVENQNICFSAITWLRILSISNHFLSVSILNADCLEGFYHRVQLSL